MLFLTASICRQLLLDLARVVFDEQSNLPGLIHKVLAHTQATLHCEHCQILLLDEVSHVSDHRYMRMKCRAVLILVTTWTVKVGAARYTVVLGGWSFAAVTCHRDEDNACGVDYCLIPKLPCFNNRSPI